MCRAQELLIECGQPSLTVHPKCCAPLNSKCFGMAIQSRQSLFLSAIFLELALGKQPNITMHFLPTLKAGRFCVLFKCLLKKLQKFKSPMSQAKDYRIFSSISILKKFQNGMTTISISILFLVVIQLLH